jgi:hypothetical protein
MDRDDARSNGYGRGEGGGEERRRKGEVGESPRIG